MNIIALQKEKAAVTAREAKAACDEEREVTDTIDGVDVVLKYEGTQGRGSVTVWSGVFLNGERFGTETEYHPWTVFKDISVYYSCGEYMLKEQAERLLEQTGVTDARIVEEPYPVDEGAPRYHWHAKSLESVVKLFKATKAR